MLFYATIKQYGENPAIWIYKTNEYDKIYNKMMQITGNDHEISEDAASWCELACNGEIYEFREGEIEIEG